jgi:hypothetical protein
MERFWPRIYLKMGTDGEIPERPKGTDCKSVGDAYAGSNPALPTFCGRRMPAAVSRVKINAAVA